MNFEKEFKKFKRDTDLKINSLEQEINKIKTLKDELDNLTNEVAEVFVDLKSSIQNKRWRVRPSTTLPSSVPRKRRIQKCTATDCKKMARENSQHLCREHLNELRPCNTPHCDSKRFCLEECCLRHFEEEKTRKNQLSMDKICAVAGCRNQTRGNSIFCQSKRKDHEEDKLRNAHQDRSH